MASSRRKKTGTTKRAGGKKKAAKRKSTKKNGKPKVRAIKLGLAGGESKAVAIVRCVADQLIQDGRPEPHDDTATMNGAYNYGAEPLRNFFGGVAARLLASQPSRRFEWDGSLVTECLPKTLSAVRGKISGLTLP